MPQTVDNHLAKIEADITEMRDLLNAMYPILEATYECIEHQEKSMSELNQTLILFQCHLNRHPNRIPEK